MVPSAPAAFSRSLVHFLTVLVVLLVVRIVFFVAFFRAEMAALPLWESVRVWLMAERFDLSLASVFTLVDLSLRLGAVRSKKRGLLTAANVWFGFYVVLLALLGIVAHYYFYYYKDRFNLFFWEFFLSFENSKLVVFSIFDEIPVFQAAFYGVFLIGLGLKLPGWLQTHATWATRFSEWLAARPARVLACYLLLLFGCRATFELPLPMQRMRGQVSPYKPLNFIHGNAVYDLYQSHNMVFARGNRTFGNEPSAISRAQAATAFQNFVVEAPQLRLFKQTSQTIEPYYRTTSVREQYLKAKPKHIVYVLMESFGSWSFNSSADDFGFKTSPFFNKFVKEGLYFDDYFAAGTGTIANIMKTVLQIHLPVNFPMEVTFTESYRPFATSMVHLAKTFGYKPQFFYGGSLDWHNMEYLLPKIGFEEVIGENRLPDAEHTRFGIFDKDLFDYVRQSVHAAAETPTFNVVMTLSNHPPFRIPKHYTLTYSPQVPTVWQTFLKDPDNFTDRYRSQRYADWAMQEFMEAFKNQPEFNDTLFIFTADHANDGAFRWPDSDIYQTRKIPLLLYAPGLLKVPPQVVHARGGHLDMGATLASLLAGPEESPFEQASFGQSLLAPDLLPQRPLLSYELDCLEDVCIYQFKAYRLSADEKLNECGTEDHACTALKEKILARRKTFDTAGTYYFFQ